MFSEQIYVHGVQNCTRDEGDWSGRRESNPRYQLGRLGLYQLSYTREGAER